jgi:hypothetical protein
LKRVWEVLHPYPEVVEGRVTEDSFVVAVGGIWERLELGRSVEVDPRYLDPEGFYRRTHFTEAMRSILKSIIQRLNGESVQSTYHLRVGMGGGKSHTLLLLYYLVRNRDQVMPFLRHEGISQNIPKARVVILDGTRISPLFGFTYPDGTRVNTLWGLLFRQLGVYDAYRGLDTWKEAPPIPVLREVLSPEPTIILVDELTPYVAQLGDKWDRVQAFLLALTAAVKETRGCVLVVTTPIGVYEEAYRLIAPILDRYSKPMILASGAEYKEIRRRALFQDDFHTLKEEIASLAQEYRNFYAIHLPSYAAQAEEAILDNYPFHPFVDRTLLKLKNKQAFQEVRDELRFLAGLVYSVYKAQPSDAHLITIGHAELTDQYVRAGTIAKLQDPILVNRLDSDMSRITGTFEPDLEQAGMRVLTVIVLNSLAAETPLQLGVTEEEIVYALLTPDLHPALLRKALAECGKKLWFVNLTDGRWVFGSPNLTKLMDDYLHKVERDRSLRGLWWDSITKELSDWKGSAYKAYLKDTRERKVKPLFEEGNIHIWPGRSEEIPDDRSIKLVLLDYHLPLASVVPEEYLSEDERAASIVTRVASSREEAVQAAKEFYENYGKSSRTYKNTVFFLVADRALVEKDGPIRYAKQLLALNEMLKDREQLRPLIGETGLKGLEQMREVSIRDLLPSCVTVYRYLLYPCRDGLATIELGEERRNLTGFLTMVETKLRTQAQKIIDNIDVDSLLTRYWPHGRPRPEVQELVEGFYKRPELELVSEAEAIERAIRTALREGSLLYTYGQELYYKREPPKLEENGVLLKEFELITLSFEAVDEHSNPLSIPVIIDNKLRMVTPFTLEDLREATHTLAPEIPRDMVLIGWSDGVQEQMRTLTWDVKRTLRLLLKTQISPPPEVLLALEAVDVSKNQPLNVSVWLDDLLYRTPHQVKVAKDSVHEVRLERPPDLMFIGWNDRVEELERKIACDVDTRLVAKFRPIAGMEIWEGSVRLGEAYDRFRQVMDREANQLRFRISMDYTSFMRHSGSLGMLLRESHEATLAGTGGSKMGLKLFTMQVSGSSDKLGVMRSSLAQLKDYLETVTVTLSLQLRDYKPVREVVSKDALEALRSAEGLLEYRAQLRGIGVKENHPKRTLEGLIESFKKEA